MGAGVVGVWRYVDEGGVFLTGGVIVAAMALAGGVVGRSVAVAGGLRDERGAFVGALEGRMVDKSGSDESMDKASSETTVEEDDGLGWGAGFKRDVIFGCWCFL
jgi:hypothetical protein